MIIHTLYPAVRKCLPWGVLPLLLLFTACNTDRLKETPTAFGQPNDVMLIADEGILQGPIKDTLFNYFESDYLVLPQPEPAYDMRYHTLQEVAAEPRKKELRNLFFVADLNDTSSNVTKLVLKDLIDDPADSTFVRFGKDKWALKQNVVYIYGYGKEALARNIQLAFPVIARQLPKMNRWQIEANVYLKGRNSNLADTIAQKFGLRIDLPGDYVPAIAKPNFLWLRKEMDLLSSSLMIARIPYTSQDQFSATGIKNIRDSLGLNITSTTDGSHMITNDRDLPLITTLKSNKGKTAMIAHGIWEMDKEFMGGPFVSQLMVHPNGKELLYLEGFLFAPGKKKRDFLQHLEYLLGISQW